MWKWRGLCVPLMLISFLFVANVLFGFVEFGTVGRDFLCADACQIIRERVGNHEVAVRQTLHERGRAEAVCAVVGEVGFAENEEPGNRAFEGVVNPKTAHCVVRSGVYAHGCFVRVFARDAFVHVEEVAVLFLDRFKAVALDCVGKVEVNAASFAVDCRPYAASVVAGFLCRARGDVAGSEVAERGILSFQIVVAVFFGDFRRLLCAVFLLLGNPHAAVVAERFAHERELALLVAVLRNAGGVDLREAGVCEARAALVAAESRRDAATLRVCGEVEYVAVAARCRAEPRRRSIFRWRRLRGCGR